MSSAIAAKKDSGRNIKFFIGLVIIYGFGYICPAFGGITPLGMKMLGVMIGLIFMTCVGCDIFASSMFALFAFVVHGYYNAAGLLTNWMGTATVYQLFFCSALCLALRETGAMDVIAKKMITSKIAKGRPAILMCMVLLCGFIVSIFLGGAGYFFLFYGLVDSIAAVCGYDDNSDFKKFALLGLYVGHYGSTLLPFKGVMLSTIGIFNGSLESYGYRFNEMTFILMNIITWVGLVVLFVLSMKFIFRVDMKKLATLDVNKIESMRNVPDHLDRRMWVSIGSLVFCLAYILLTMFLPKSFPGYAVITSLGTSLIWGVPLVVLWFVRGKDGKPYFNTPKLLKDGGMWNMVALVGAMTLLGKVCTDTNLGIRDWITSLFLPIFGDMPLWLLMLALVVTVTVLTQVINGQPLTMALAPVISTLVCTSMANGAAGNPTIFLGTVSNCANVAFLTVSGSVSAAYILNRKEITQKFLWTKGVAVLCIYMVWQFVVSAGLNFLLAV